MSILSLHPNAFGLNITDAKIRAVELKKEKSEFSLVGFFEEDLDSGIVKDGEIADKEKLTERLKNILNKKTGTGIKTRNVVFSLPEFKTFIQMADVPANLFGDELGEAVRWEAESNIPVPINDVYIDWKIVPDLSHKNTQKIFLAAAPKKLVDDYAGTLEAAGFYVAAAELEPVALARVVLNAKLNESNAALIIDVSDLKTIFVIAHKNVVRFTSSIPQNELEIVAGEAERALNFAKEHVIKSENIDLILAGNKASLKDYSQTLSKQLGVDAYTSDPWDKIKKSKKQSRIISSATAFTALGLAIRAANLNIYDK